MGQVVKEISQILDSIISCDHLEQMHLEETKAWVESGAPLFRIKKPDVPNKHLVSYFLLFDFDAQKVLLVDHKKAQLWLPTGGHVEVDEHPKQAVIRECKEELGVDAEFFYEHPIFLTSTETVGLTAGHTDVSLWYVLKGDHRQKYHYDQEEFNAVQWFELDRIPFGRSDPHMKRFIEKLKTNSVGNANML